MSTSPTIPEVAALATQANELIGSLAERFAEDHEGLEDVVMIPDFHYEQGLELDVIAHALNIETAKMGRAVRISLDHAIICGKLLLVAKLSLKHGAWARWLEANTTISCRSASGYMRLASNRKRIADLDCGVAAALELLADQSEKSMEPAKPEVSAPAPAPAPARRSPPPLIIDAEIVDPATVPQDGPEPDAMVVDGTATPPVEAPPSPPKAAPHVSNNSGDHEWFTPARFIESARAVMEGIDLDPASCDIANKTVGAAKFYTKDKNGLTQPWKGTVWMNPPYAQPLIQQFADRLVAEVKKGTVTQAIALVNNGTETAWFQAMAGAAAAICFPSRRVQFLDPNGNPGAPLQGQALIYFGNRAQRFIDTFKNHGQCVVVVKPTKTGGTASE